MDNINKFNSGDLVSYKDGMDFKDFSGVVQSAIKYKDLWQYNVKDTKDDSIKRVGERFLTFTVEDRSKQRKNKFNIGQSVSYINERDFQAFKGIVERCIHNYLGQWQYIVKDPAINQTKRIDEKYLQLNNTPEAQILRSKF